MTESNSAQSGAQLLVRSLEAQGVPFVFGIPGGAISPILDALADGGPQFITVRHETAGAFMAQAYGRCTGRPGVVLTTSGPGLINAVCGVATAQADRDPVVAITGQVPRTMRFKSYHQYLDTVGLFAPIIAEEAARMHDRGPCHTAPMPWESLARRHGRVLGGWEDQDASDLLTEIRPEVLPVTGK